MRIHDTEIHCVLVMVSTRILKDIVSEVSVQIAKYRIGFDGEHSPSQRAIQRADRQIIRVSCPDIDKNSGILCGKEFLQDIFVHVSFGSIFVHGYASSSGDSAMIL